MNSTDLTPEQVMAELEIDELHEYVELLEEMEEGYQFGVRFSVFKSLALSRRESKVMRAMLERHDIASHAADSDLGDSKSRLAHDTAALLKGGE
jgi:hypothetical protein